MSVVGHCERCGRDVTAPGKLCPECEKRDAELATRGADTCPHCGAAAAARRERCPECRLRPGAPIQHVLTRAVCTSGDSDGRDLQAALGKLATGRGAARDREQLRLDYNEHGRVGTQVAVKRMSGETLGYLTPNLADDVLSASRAGCNFGCYLLGVTSVKKASGDLGASLLLLQYSPRTTPAQARAYAIRHRLM